MGSYILRLWLIYIQVHHPIRFLKLETTGTTVTTSEFNPATVIGCAMGYMRMSDEWWNVASALCSTLCNANAEVLIILSRQGVTWHCWDMMTAKAQQ